MPKKRDTRIVFPVPGFYLATVPAVPHECADPFCVESGAFTTQPPPPTVAEPIPDDPPDGGSSDSTED